MIKYFKNITNSSLKIILTKYFFLVLVFLFTSTLQAKKADPIDKLKLNSSDESGNELKSLKAEMLIRKSEIKAIKQLKRLIKKHRGKSLEPHLVYRLTELYMRRVKAERFFEVHRKSDLVVSLLPKIVKNASSLKYVKRSIKLYDYIIKKFPEFEQIDTILFNNAYARQEINDHKTAEKLYWQIIKNHKESPLVPDAHFAIAEISFLNKKFEYALQHFKAILKYPDSKVYPYGIYKSAWVLYNLNDGKSGIKKLEEVIRLSRNTTGEQKKSNFSLLNEALTDLTLFYQETYKPENAYNYFSKVTTKAELPTTLISLTDTYERHGKYKEANTVLMKFNKHHVDSEHTSEILQKISWNFENLRNRPKATQYLSRLSENCKKKPTEECREIVSETSYQLGHKWRNLWVKNKGHKVFGSPTETAFKIYLENSEPSKEAIETRFLLAEMLFARKKYNEAMENYHQTAKQTTDKQKKHDSIYGAIVSLQKSIDDKWDTNQQQKYETLANFYLSEFKNGKYKLDILFKKALIYYEKDDIAQAKPIFLELGKAYPEKKKGLKSQDLYLDILNQEKRYSEIKTYTKSLMNSDISSKRSLEITKLYQQAYFLEIQSIEQAKNLEKAFQGYIALASENPNSELASKAIWNSALVRKKQKKYQEAASQFVHYFEKFPRDEQAISALINAAQIYQNSFENEKAIKYIFKLEVVDKKNSKKWQNLAFNLLESENKHEDILKILIKRFKTRSKNRNQIVEKIYQTHQLMASKPLLKDLQSSVNKILFKYGQPHHAHYLTYLKAKGYKKSRTQKYKEVMVQVIPQLENKKLKAEAYLDLAKLYYQQLKQIDLNVSLSKFPQTLSRKVKNLELAQRYLLRVIKQDLPETKAVATYTLALSYKNYIDSIQNVRPPRGLPKKDHSSFKEELIELISPIEDKYADTLHKSYLIGRNTREKSIDYSLVKTELNKLQIEIPLESTLSTPDTKIEVPILREAASTSTEAK